MIKNWKSFNEAKDPDNLIDQYEENLKKIGDKSDIEGIIGLIDKYFVVNYLEPLFKYVEYRYNKLSKEIKEFLDENLEGTRWTDGTLSIILDINVQTPKFGDKYLFVEKIINYYKSIKDELDKDGYPEPSDLYNKIEHICDTSLDNDIAELTDIREEYNGVFIEISGKDITIEKFSLISDELIQLKGRIENIGLKETGNLTFREESDIFGINLHFV